jgi:hypothetical protein
MIEEPTTSIDASAESRRLAEADEAGWRRWGPYLAERQWGTVREDYSANGDAWDYFPHDHARWRAYRWGEDGIAGFSDDKQHWCLGLALWNGQDPILKERMFGLANEEGNHGEDAKELWWYLDGTPTHSLMRMLYKYPHAAFPYEALVEENAARKGKALPEYEIEDTGVFDGGRYFDVAVDYAKASPEDIAMRLVITNRGPEAASLHVLPQLWARNSWSWDEDGVRPVLALREDGCVDARRADEPVRRFEALQPATMLFCDNDTDRARLCGEASSGHPKDGIGECIVGGRAEAVNPANTGTKCAAYATLTLAPGESRTLRYRFAPETVPAMDAAAFDALFETRIAEADAFYAAIQQGIDDPDARLVQRQALAGMLWSKQYYRFDVRRWLAGDPTQPSPPAGRTRARDWRFFDADDVISMPDCWEYPWFASWDLAFHCVTYALVDPAFAKRQLLLLLQQGYMNPNGQIPAYEWEFGDANPPVQAWAALRIYRMETLATGQGDRSFLREALHKLMLNFTWWVNRRDIGGLNLFEGGFLGLDNIGVFDRSKPLPTGGHIEQADGTAWMAMYALDLMRIALELSAEDNVYESIAIKFFNHFLLIAEAMTDLPGGDGPDTGLWDDLDGFYYDMLNLPDGERVPLRVRSLVGLIPLCAVAVLDAGLAERCPGFVAHLRWTFTHSPTLASLVSRWEDRGAENRMLLSLLRYQRMQRLLFRMLGEEEFLSPFGIRSVSKVHAQAPYTYDVGGTRFLVDYEPGESTTAMFGGNSNWRGPVWMPINVLLVEALYEFEAFYGDDVEVELPTDTGRTTTLAGAAAEITRRLTSLLLKGPDGERPAVRGNALYRDDPHFAGLVPFHEYFHADSGKGLGASHQTGWTGLIALLLQPRRREAGALTPEARAGQVQ